MPDISYAPTFPFADGNEVDPEDFFRKFYKDDSFTSSDSLLAVNGLLDVDNFDVDFSVKNYHTQRGSCVTAEGCSGTANLDFKGSAGNTSDSGYSLFGEHSPVDFGFAFDRNDPHFYVPGANKTFYSRWPCKALVMWQAYYTNAHYSQTSSQFIHLFLMADGSYVEQQSRYAPPVGAVVSAFSPNQRMRVFNVLAYERARYWSGHALIELTEGWHTVGLALSADYRVNAARVHARSIDVVLFRD